MSKACLLSGLAVLLACAGEAPPTGPDANPDLAAGGVRGKPSAGTTGVTILNLGYYRGRDIDDAGRVVVWQSQGGAFRSLLVDPASSQATDLGDLGGGDTEAARMNQSLQIAGSSKVGNAFRPVLREGGVLHQLPEPAGSTGGEAADVADAAGPDDPRWVVGSVAGYGGVPAVWIVSGAGAGFTASAPTLLPVPAGGGGMASGVNRNGVAVGSYGVAGAGPLPATWSRNASGSWQRTALTVPAGQTFAQALDVNAAGVAVGISGGTAGCNRGVVWVTPTSTPVLLPDLAGGTCAWASAINDAGHITGIAGGRAVLWTARAGGGYAVRNLGLPKGARSAEGHGLNEPRPGAAGVTIVEIAGQASTATGSRAIVWRVTLP